MFGGYMDSPSLSSRASGVKLSMIHTKSKSFHDNNSDDQSSLVSSLASYASTKTGTYRRQRRMRGFNNYNNNGSVLSSYGCITTVLMILAMVAVVQHVGSEQLEQELDRWKSWATISLSITGNNSDAEDARFRSETNPINAASMQEAMAASRRAKNQEKQDNTSLASHHPEIPNSSSSNNFKTKALRGGTQKKNKQQTNTQKSVETIHLSAALSKRVLQEATRGANYLYPVQIYTHYDGHPEHIQWTIGDAISDTKVVHRKAFAGEPEEVIFIVKLSPGLYYFEMTDSLGDGLCCADPQHPDGKFALAVSDNDEVDPLLQGSDFGAFTGKLYFRVEADGSGSVAAAPVR